MTASFTQTTTYNKPIISFPYFTGLTINGNPPASLDVPLLLTRYTVPQAKVAVSPITTMPVSSVSLGNALAGNVVELNKTFLEGQIDTPINSISALTVLQVDSVNYHYIDVIAMYIEGRVNGAWLSIQPTFFRDPYGRQYNNPTIVDLSGNYVEGAPGRTMFTMELIL